MVRESSFVKYAECQPESTAANIRSPEEDSFALNKCTSPDAFVKDTPAM